jgi:hypothetical protein
MKKITMIGLLSLAAAGAYAQGTINFANNAGGFISHIWSPDPTTPSVQTTGNTATDVPAGVAVYNGTKIGGSSGAAGTPINYAFGNNFTVQLYANATGTGKALSSLVPVASYITTLATTSGANNAGFIVANNLIPDPGIPNPNADADALSGTLDNRATAALACWYNAGGTITSLAAASAAEVPYGESAAFNVTGMGEPSSIMTDYNGTPTGATQAAYLSNLKSFDLVGSAVPEPSTIALGVMGACAFLARRRNKK